MKPPSTSAPPKSCRFLPGLPGLLLLLMAASSARADIITTGTLTGAGTPYNGTDNPWVTGDLIVGADPFTGATLTITGGSTVVSTSGLIGLGSEQGAGSVTVGGGTGAANWTISGSLTIGQSFFPSGPLNINAGGTVTADSVYLIGTDALATKISGGTLRITGTYPSYSYGSFNILSGGGTFDITNASGSLSVDLFGTGGFTKTGLGTLLFSQNQFYSGPTVIRGGGTLWALGGGGGALPGSAPGHSLADRSAVILDDIGPGGTTLRIGTGGFDDYSYSAKAASLTGAASSTVALGGDALTIGASSGTTAFAGSIIGDGGTLTKDGASTQTLSGTNSYTGGTTISAGTLQLGSGGTTGSLSSSGAITNNATLVFNRSNTLTQGTDFANSISGTGVVTQLGSGITVLSGSNTYSGGTTVNAGVLTFLNVNAKPSTGTVTVASGATLGLGVGTAGSFFTSADVDSLFTGTLAGVTSAATSNVGIDTTAGNFTYATSVASNTKGLVKLGANTLTLSGVNTYTGGTTVSGGTLNVTNATGSATGTGALSVEAPATLSGTGHIVLGLGASANIAGRLEVGDTTLPTPVASTLQISTSGLGSTSLAAGSVLAFDLFTGAGNGNNSAISTAADILRLGGNLSIDPAALLQVSNPNNMTAWAVGDRWEVFDWTNIGSITGGFSLANIALPTLGAGLAWDTSNLFTTTGAFSGTIDVTSIGPVPEPGTIAVGLICLGVGMARRRRNVGGKEE